MKIVITIDIAKATEEQITNLHKCLEHATNITSLGMEMSFEDVIPTPEEKADRSKVRYFALADAAEADETITKAGDRAMFGYILTNTEKGVTAKDIFHFFKGTYSHKSVESAVQRMRTMKFVESRAIDPAPQG